LCYGSVGKLFFIHRYTFCNRHFWLRVWYETILLISFGQNMSPESQSKFVFVSVRLFIYSYDALYPHNIINHDTHCETSLSEGPRPGVIGKIRQTHVKPKKTLMVFPPPVWYYGCSRPSSHRPSTTGFSYY